MICVSCGCGAGIAGASRLGGCSGRVRRRRAHQVGHDLGRDASVLPCLPVARVLSARERRRGVPWQGDTVRRGGVGAGGKGSTRQLAAPTTARAHPNTPIQAPPTHHVAELRRNSARGPRDARQHGQAQHACRGQKERNRKRIRREEGTHPQACDHAHRRWHGGRHRRRERRKSAASSIKAQ